MILLFSKLARTAIVRAGLAGMLMAGAGCSLVTVPVKTAGNVVETTVKTTGSVVEAPFKAAGGHYREPEPVKKTGHSQNGE